MKRLNFDLTKDILKYNNQTIIKDRNKKEFNELFDLIKLDNIANEYLTK